MKDNIRERVFNHKNYGSIGHLPESRMGEGDHHINLPQANIAILKPRDRNDLIIIQEKLDGSNVGVYKDEAGELIAVTRSGYKARDSKLLQHRLFAQWVEEHAVRFETILNPKERIVGEWLLQAHGTRYNLNYDELFVAFDLFTPDNKRISYLQFIDRLRGLLRAPALLHIGGSLSVEHALINLTPKGFHNAIDDAEGVVYRVEKKKNKKDEHYKVDFLAKYVKPDKIDGCYFENKNEGLITWNYRGTAFGYQLPDRIDS